MNSIPHKCYYWIQSEFGSVDEYERHIVVHYPGLPGYPGPADIELYGLKKRGMSWGRHKSKHGMEIVNHGQNQTNLVSIKLLWLRREIVSQYGENTIKEAVVYQI